jgi:hypothetical protein
LHVAVVVPESPRLFEGEGLRTRHVVDGRRGGRRPVAVAAGAAAAAGDRRRRVLAWQTLGMSERKWFDRTQPQTLQSAVLLSYLNAGIAIFYVLVSRGVSSYLLLVLLGAALGANGIANEQKWGYVVCLGCAGLYLLFWVLLIVTFAAFSFGVLVNLLFALVLVALLLHPESREYRRIWFR